jgi:FlaA1/EpsC-like NDP-sugar epimerase
MELLQEMGIQNFVSVLGQIQDKDLMERIFKAHAPDVVFHAAAYKHVPLLEENPWQAVTNNIIGSRVLMETAARHNVHKFVVVSTDKAVRPTNVMGASKRMTEIIMHYMNGNQGRTAFMAVRFGNVVGSSGSVIPLFERQIKRGGPLTVTHEEVTRFFMTIEEASQLILQAGALGEGGEIFILDMGTPVKIMDMARDLIRLMGKVPDEDIAIKVVGLRPGEKLYEELITRGEGIVQAGHEKIMVLKPENQSTIWNGDFSHKMTEALQELEKSAAEKDGEQIRRILKSIINEYSPASSRTTLCS